MSHFSYDELALVLALYYFDNDKINQKYLNEFTKKLNEYFHKDISTQNVSYAISIFKSINPFFNTKFNQSIENEMYISVWNDYIGKDLQKDLREIFVNFKKNNYVNKKFDYNDDKLDFELGELINIKFYEYNFSYNGDYPKNLYIDVEYNTYINKRDPNVSYNALKLAEFTCEFSENHKSFQRKKSNINYSEGHHLIPLKYQYLYSNNLDVEANIVSLCSECHNRIHYGAFNNDIIKLLYLKRKERLKKCNIIITLEELLKMY